MIARPHPCVDRFGKWLVRKVALGGEEGIGRDGVRLNGQDRASILVAAMEHIINRVSVLVGD